MGIRQTWADTPRSGKTAVGVIAAVVVVAGAAAALHPQKTTVRTWAVEAPTCSGGGGFSSIENLTNFTHTYRVTFRFHGGGPAELVPVEVDDVAPHRSKTFAFAASAPLSRCDLEDVAVTG